MCVLKEFILDLYSFIIGKAPVDETLIKMHTRNIEEIGDLSFPLKLKNWHKFLDNKVNIDIDNILSYKLKETDNVKSLNKIKENLNNIVKIWKCEVIKNNAHLFLERTSLFQIGIQNVLKEESLYGSSDLFKKHIEIIIDESIPFQDDHANLTTLRLLILRSVTVNLIHFTSSLKVVDNCNIFMSSTDHSRSQTIICGPVINQDGIKDTQNLAIDLFTKRSSDMRMMAQHRYRVSVKPNSEWHDYFLKLGVSSVTIELLTNKPHKPVKVSLNDLSTANKGPSFIFYNCARLCVLLHEFDKKVENGFYVKLPELEKTDFGLLTQPEEWELLYVYILQFPLVIKSCIKDIERGILNPQHLITFLSNLSSVFSVYYRRVRILTDPREHLFAIIHARIYLLKALQHVFHNALKILNIEPIKEM